MKQPEYIEGPKALKKFKKFAGAILRQQFPNRPDVIG